MEALLAETERQFDEASLIEEIGRVVPRKPLPHEKAVRTVPSMNHFVILLPEEREGGEHSIEEQVTVSKNVLVDTVKSHARCLQNCGLGMVYGFELKVVAPPRIIRDKDGKIECCTLVAYFIFFDCSVDHKDPFTCEHGRVHSQCQCGGH